MKSVARLILGAILLSTMLSCGGSLASNSVFAGVWSGTFTNPSNAQTGTISVVIDQGGAANGTGTNTTLSHSYDISGFIEDNGQISWAKSGGETGSFDGTLAIDGNGHLVGTVVQTTGSTSVDSTIDLTLQ